MDVIELKKLIREILDDELDDIIQTGWMSAVNLDEKDDDPTDKDSE